MTNPKSVQTNLELAKGQNYTVKFRDTHKTIESDKEQNEL